MLAKMAEHEYVKQAYGSKHRFSICGAIKLPLHGNPAQAEVAGVVLQTAGMPVAQWEYNNLLRSGCNPPPPPAEQWRIELHEKLAGKVFHAKIPFCAWVRNSGHLPLIQRPCDHHLSLCKCSHPGPVCV